MKLITRETDYALRALIRMSGSNEKCSARGLSEEMNIPWSFMRNILKRLNQAGILVSRKGRSGGFEFIRSPEEITLKEVVEIFQGPLRLLDCSAEDAACANIGDCPVRDSITGLEDHMKEVLGDITIKTLAGRGK